MILEQFNLGMEVLAWYIDPNGIENKIPTDTHTLLVLENVKSLISIPEGYPKRDDTSPTQRDDTSTLQGPSNSCEFAFWNST
jgi:hypothetical protein